MTDKIFRLRNEPYKGQKPHIVLKDKLKRAERRSKMKKRMRKIFTKVVLASIAIAAVTCFAVAVAMAEVSGKFIITGYATGETAIKARVESDIEQLVFMISQKKNENDQLFLAVIGSADITGISAENDKLAKERAEQVGAVLSHHFPTAKINVWSKGDEENVRQVKVEYKITPIPKPAPAPAPIIIQQVAPTPTPVPLKKSNVRKAVEILGASFGLAIVVVALVILFVFLWRRKSKSNSRKPVEEIFIIEIDGSVYRVPVQWDSQWFWSPFVNLKGGGQIRQKQRGEMKSSLRGCLTKESFKTQREELLRKHIIEVAQGK